MTVPQLREREPPVFTPNTTTKQPTKTTKTTNNKNKETTRTKKSVKQQQKLITRQHLTGNKYRNKERKLTRQTIERSENKYSSEAAKEQDKQQQQK